jgi:hypothetical protein
MHYGGARLDLMDLASRFASLLKERWGERLLTVALFGSVARGEALPESDIDVIIVAKGLPRGRFARNRLLEPIESELGDPPLSPVLLTPEEAARTRPLYLDLTQDAQLLFDREGFFEAILGGLRKKLEALGSVRHRMGRSWYWDLKPTMKPGETIEL